MAGKTGSRSLSAVSSVKTSHSSYNGTQKTVSLTVSKDDVSDRLKNKRKQCLWHRIFLGGGGGGGFSALLRPVAHLDFIVIIFFRPLALKDVFPTTRSDFHRRLVAQPKANVKVKPINPYHMYDTLNKKLLLKESQKLFSVKEIATDRLRIRRSGSRI